MHPLPRREGKMQISEKHTEWNYKKIYQYLIIIFTYSLYSIICTHFDISFIFLIRIPEDILNQEFLQTRALCKFSTEFLGCWKNRIFHTSVMYVSEFTTLVQMGIVSAMLFLQTWLNFAQNPNSNLSSPFGKMRDLHIRKFVWFSRIRENTKNKKLTFFTYLQIVKNSKKFSYTWFISPRIIYCLVPRQPPVGGWGIPMGDPSRKVYTFRDVEILLNLDCVHLHVHTIFL